MDDYCLNYPTRIISGQHAIEQLEREVEEGEIVRLGLVTDNLIRESGLVELLIGELNKLEVVAEYDQVPPNSGVEVVERGAEYFADHDIDALLALG